MLCEKLRPGLNGALFVRRYDEQKSGSGGRKRRHKKNNKLTFDLVKLSPKKIVIFDKAHRSQKKIPFK